MSERYTAYKSWDAERATQVTQEDTVAYTRDISKQHGMCKAVKHLQEQLLLPENVESAPAQAVEQSEQSALQALDQLQVTLGRVLKQKGMLTVSKTQQTAVCGLGAVWSLHDELDKWVLPAGGGATAG
jgi:hypothetical protein